MMILDKMRLFTRVCYDDGVDDNHQIDEYVIERIIMIMGMIYVCVCDKRITATVQWFNGLGLVITMMK